MTISIYMCISWNFIQYIIDDFKILDLDKDSDGNFLEYTPKMWLIRGICMVAVMLIILPLSLLKDMSSLRFMAIINLMVLFYVIVLGCAQAAGYIEHYKETGDYKIEYYSKMPCMDWLAGTATIILSFMCHPNFFYIRKELMNPSKPRVKKVLQYSILTETFIYLVMGIAGYLTLGDTNMVSLFALRPAIGSGGDWLMKFAVVLFLMLSLGNVGINFFPCRESLVSVLGAGDKPKVRAICAIGILVCSGIITLVYPNIMSIFSLSGGLLCCYIGWVFPFLIMVRTMPEKKWYHYPKLFYYMGLYFMIFISVGSTVQSLFRFDF